MAQSGRTAALLTVLAFHLLLFLATQCVEGIPPSLKRKSDKISKNSTFDLPSDPWDPLGELSLVQTRGATSYYDACRESHKPCHVFSSKAKSRKPYLKDVIVEGLFMELPSFFQTLRETLDRVYTIGLGCKSRNYSTDFVISNGVYTTPFFDYLSETIGQPYVSKYYIETEQVVEVLRKSTFLSQLERCSVHKGGVGLANSCIHAATFKSMILLSAENQDLSSLVGDASFLPYYRVFFKSFLEYICNLFSDMRSGVASYTFIGKYAFIYPLLEKSRFTTASLDRLQVFLDRAQLDFKWTPSPEADASLDAFLSKL